MSTVISDSQILFGQLRLIYEKEYNTIQNHTVTNEAPIVKYDKEIHGAVILSNSSGEWRLVDGYSRIKAMIAGRVPDETVIEYK